MDNAKDDSYGLSNVQGYGSSIRSKFPVHNAEYSRTNNHYGGDEEDVDDDELGGEEGGTNGVRVIGKDNYDDEDDTEDDDNNDENEDMGDDNDDNDNGMGIPRPQKKRKFRSLMSDYKFAPRMPAPPSHQAASFQPLFGGVSVGTDWTEHETFALLDAWGNRFLKLGRKSLRSEEWQEVAEKLSQELNIERTEAQCRNKLDTLKKKYKKEKTKLGAGGGGSSSKWPFFKKMDVLMYTPQQQAGLSCGIDSGEYVFMNPKVYLNQANGLDEMRDSPGNSESSGDKEDSDGLPPKGKSSQGRRADGSSFRVLADSIQKFSKIYEKFEINKRKQLMELENMRMDFQRQLETQRREILLRAQAEIAKIRQGDEDETALSAENPSG